jgi:NhaP-type Na+/H+ or K+/H+ antiporter
MARRPVAAVAAALLFLEAVGIVLLNMILGIAVDRQHMSLGGLDPDAMSVSTWIGGGLFGLYLAFCGFVLLRGALRDRAPGRFARILLISCAVVHGVLGALTVGLVGWLAFAFMMVVIGLIVLTLLAYEPNGAGNGDNGASAAAAGANPA